MGLPAMSAVTAALVGLATAAATYVITKSKREKSNSKATSRLISKQKGLPTSHADEHSIVSFNVLAKSLASLSKQGHVLPQYLAWDHRWPLIQKELEACDADIVCLQEVDIDWMDQYSGLFAARGYAAIFQDKDSHAVVNAIFYKPKYSLWWEQHRSRAIVAAFTYEDSLGSLQALYVVNAHLEGSPYKPQERVNQIKSALQRVQQHQERHGLSPRDCNTLVCGDFNSDYWGAVCQFLYRGSLPGGYTESWLPTVTVTKTDISHPYDLMDAYLLAGRQLPFTRKVPQLASSLDFIWVSSFISVEAVYWPYTPEDLALIKENSLPNERFPSDHVPIGVVLRIPPIPAGQEVLQEEAGDMDNGEMM